MIAVKLNNHAFLIVRHQGANEYIRRSAQELLVAKQDQASLLAHFDFHSRVAVTEHRFILGVTFKIYNRLDSTPRSCFLSERGR